MGREKQGYRDTLAALDELYPDKGTLNKTQVARFLGVTVDTVRRSKIRFSEVTGRVTKADLARQICL